jgi:carbon-monoxide dehydrogenase medium subunit
MRPAPFDYVQPATVEEAVAALSDRDGARPLAGGQILINRMRARVERPGLVVDISRLPGLAFSEADGDQLRVGALTVLADLTGADVAAWCPALQQAAQSVGDPQVRNRATVAGNLLNPDPVSDIAPVLLASGGSVVLQGTDGRREVDAGEFLEAPAPRLGPTELIVELRFGRLSASSAFEKLSRRQADAAVASAAAFVRTDGGRITEVGLALSAVHEHPLRAATVCEQLTGGAFDATAAMEALRAFAGGLRPPSTPHADADYRKEVAPVVALRALQRAIDTANRR